MTSATRLTQNVNTEDIRSAGLKKRGRETNKKNRHYRGIQLFDQAFAEVLKLSGRWSRPPGRWGAAAGVGGRGREGRGGGGEEEERPEQAVIEPSRSHGKIIF